MKPDIVAELFAKYHNYALVYVYSLCRNSVLAEDIVANAFFKALAAADDSVHSFKAWLLTVCRNEYMTYCRKQKRVSPEEPGSEIPSDEADIAQRLIKEEQYRALYRAISMLPDEQREVIVLFYFSGISVKEISQTLGKSQANTKVLLHRARKSLKKILEVQ